eukprot:COSAG03_NODE_242_length_10073_cov_30.040405_6_plen_169_part_00
MEGGREGSLCGAYVELMREAREHIFLVGTLQPRDIRPEIAPFHAAHEGQARAQQGEQAESCLARRAAEGAPRAQLRREEGPEHAAALPRGSPSFSASLSASPAIPGPAGIPNPTAVEAVVSIVGKAEGVRLIPWSVVMSLRLPEEWRSRCGRRRARTQPTFFHPTHPR